MPAAAPVRADRLRGPPEGRGCQPDRLLQGPRDDRGHHQGRRGRSQAVICASHRQHLGLRRGLRARGPGSPARCWCRPARSRLASWRRRWCTARSCSQVDGNFDDCLRLARDLAENYPVALVNSVNPDRIEGQKTAAFEVCDAPGWRARRALPPGRQRRQHHRLLARLLRVRRRAGPTGRAAAHVRLPGRRRGADRARRAGRVPVDHRDRHPDRQPGFLAAGDRGARRVRRRHRRGHRPSRSWRRTGCSRRARGSSSSQSCGERRRAS